MSNEFKCEDRVATKVTDRHSHVRYGKVLTALDGGDLLVEWDEQRWGASSKMERLSPSKLMTETEAKYLINKLETEFSELEDKVAEKLDEAAKLIREAGTSATAHGETLHDMYEATGTLIEAMDDAGWNTSSWNC